MTDSVRLKIRRISSTCVGSGTRITPSRLINANGNNIPRFLWILRKNGLEGIADISFQLRDRAPSRLAIELVDIRQYFRHCGVKFFWNLLSHIHHPEDRKSVV